ncbi:hypothetical protein PssiTeo3_49750 [Pseudomonas sichuanensis]|nr:hypothetical protein [Pseudomonas sichuanensis]
MVGEIIYGFLNFCRLALRCDLNRQLAVRIAKVNGCGVKPGVVRIRELVAVDLVKKLLEEMFRCNVMIEKMDFSQEFCLYTDSRQILNDVLH